LFQLFIQFEMIVPWPGAKYAPATPKYGTFDRTGTCSTCSFLSFDLSGTSCNFAFFFGFVGTLPSIGQILSGIEVDGMIIGLNSKNGIVQFDLATCIFASYFTYY
jgi:hypothetical protein